MNRKTEENKLVKQALADVAIVANVAHGRGTGSGWLKIHVLNRLTVLHDKEKYGWQHCSGNCPACVDYRTLYSRTLDVARIATGRNGDYDGRINVYLEGD